MGFMDSYKQLEKLCSEVMSSKKGVSSYIDEMQNNPYGTQYVTGWSEDLKKLKHYRWVRNNIAHEPGCTEQDMCDNSDTLWLNNFHSRIMNQTDPLALYYKATKRRAQQTATQSSSTISLTNNSKHNRLNNINRLNLAVFLLIILIVIILIIIYLISLSSFNYI